MFSKFSALFFRGLFQWLLPVLTAFASAVAAQKVCQSPGRGEVQWWNDDNGDHGINNQDGGHHHDDDKYY